MVNPRRKGYDGEIEARTELRGVGLVYLERTGSLNYKDSAPDLVQPAGTSLLAGVEEPVLIVATQADRRPMLYTLSAPDLYRLVQWARRGDLGFIPVVVQVKKHRAFAIDTLYRKLQEAVK